MEKKQVYILSIKEVNFVNQETGEKIEGCSVHYIDLKKNEFGYEPAKVFLRENYNNVLKNGTGLYDLIFEITLAGGRPRITIKSFEHIKKADLNIKEL